MSDDVPAVDVPDGYLHRSALIGRGWTSALITTHLAESEIKLWPGSTPPAGIPAGTSNKAYPADVVDELERSVHDVKKALTHTRDRIPLTGVDYRTATTVDRDALLSRGWTTADIERLLGIADLGPEYSAYQRSLDPRYGRDRVEQAEAVDRLLRQRLTRKHAAVAARERKAAERQAQKAARIAAREDAYYADLERDGQVWLRKINGQWMIEGRDLQPETTVTVVSRTGKSTPAIVGAITETLPDGRVRAYFSDPPRPRPRQIPHIPVYEPARLVPLAQKLQADLADAIEFDRDFAIMDVTNGLRRRMLEAIEAVESLDAGKKLGALTLRDLGPTDDDVRALAALKGHPDALRERAIAEVAAHQARRVELIAMDVTSLNRAALQQIIAELTEMT